MKISPNNVAPWLEWGGDLVVSQNGSIVLANGWNQFKQRYLRRLLTNPSFTLQDGEKIPAGYIFDSQYGLGFRRRLGENWSDDIHDKLQALCLQGAEIDEGVDPGRPPEVTITQDQHTIFISVFVTLKTGEQGRVQFQINE